MNSDLSKVKSIFTSRAVSAIFRWSKPAHKSLLLICLLTGGGTLASLGITLATRSLIDGAVGADESALWKYGALLVALVVISRGLSVLCSVIRTKTQTQLQKHMQTMVTSSILGKEYTSLKGFHSGELVNRVFSDVSVIKGGVMNLLPSLLSIMISFFGAAAILISMDWRFLPVMILAGVIGSGLMLAFREPMKRR
ncbi:MAG: hypothetical protein IKN04_03145, partial [Clostridia bacterium]|nr:hypothetical protein [Clostridia bacterium]